MGDKGSGSARNDGNSRADSGSRGSNPRSSDDRSSRGSSGRSGKGNPRSGADRGSGRREARRDDNRHSDRGRPEDRGFGDPPEPRGEFIYDGHELPNWVKEELHRTAKRGGEEAAIVSLTKASAHFAGGRASQALDEARNAKRHAPQSPTVMETIGIAAYRGELWEESLRELRAFRRRTGDGSHLAIEMDVLRALGRGGDVEKAFALVPKAEMDAAARSEAKVVYASYLLDNGRPREAWAIAKPGRLTESPTEPVLRQWFVAARAAAATGDGATASKIATRIRETDVAFPGLDLLQEEVARAT